MNATTTEIQSPESNQQWAIEPKAGDIKQDRIQAKKFHVRAFGRKVGEVFPANGRFHLYSSSWQNPELDKGRSWDTLEAAWKDLAFNPAAAYGESF